MQLYTPMQRYLLTRCKTATHITPGPWRRHEHGHCLKDVQRPSVSKHHYLQSMHGAFIVNNVNGTQQINVHSNVLNAVVVAVVVALLLCPLTTTKKPPRSWRDSQPRPDVVLADQGTRRSGLSPVGFWLWPWSRCQMPVPTYPSLQATERQNVMAKCT